MSGEPDSPRETKESWQVMDVMVSLSLQMFVRDLRRGDTASTRDVMQGLEDLGFWGANVVDHVVQSTTDVVEHHEEPDWSWRFADPLTMIGYLAAVTTRIKLATRVLVVPYRPPIQMAHAIATADSLSGGRVIMGVAAGYDKHEYGVLGIPVSQRGSLTDEYLDIWRLLWTADGPASFEGPTVSFSDAELQIKPVQAGGPPLWIGGHSKAALRRAVRVGDGWTPSLFSYTFLDPSDRHAFTRHTLTEWLETANAQRRAEGKSRLDCPADSGMPLVFTDTPQHAGRRREDISLFSSRGTVDELLDEFQVMGQSGVTRFVVRFTGETADEFLAQAELFAREIMPHIDA